MFVKDFISHFVFRSDIDFNEENFASLLVERGASVDAFDSLNNESLLQKSVRHHYESAGIYLLSQNASINHRNKFGETALHLTSEFGLEKLTRTLLENDVDPNIQTNSIPMTTNDDETIAVGLQTAMHRAVYASQENILRLFFVERENKRFSPNFNLQDENGQSVFSLALWMNFLSIAKQLLEIGQANLDIEDCDQTPLLAQAICKQNVPAALFLLEQNVDVNRQTHGLRPIQLAVQYHLPSVVEALCRHGAMMDVLDDNGNSVLWNALDSGQEDIATILVKFGCDSTQ